MPAIEVADMRTYRYVINFEDVTIFFLYKGRISGIFSAGLQKIYNTWQPIYANDVLPASSNADHRLYGPIS